MLNTKVDNVKDVDEQNIAIIIQKYQDVSRKTIEMNQLWLILALSLC